MSWETVLKGAEEDARKHLLNYFTEIDEWAAKSLRKLITELLKFQGKPEFERMAQEAHKTAKEIEELRNLLVLAQGIIKLTDIRPAIMLARNLAEASKDFGGDAPVLELDDIIHRLGFEGME